MGTLLITVHSDDPGLHDALRENLPAEPHGKHEPDVVFVDAGPPAPASLPAQLRSAHPSAFVVLVARDVDAQALELGADLDADAYVRGDDELADSATALLALAVLARHGSRAARAGRPGRLQRSWTSRRKD